MKKALLLAAGMVALFTSSLMSSESIQPVLIDVRTAQEYEKGHLDGSILIPYDRISKEIGNVVKDKSQTIHLYCRSGRRSKIAKDTLLELGYKNVKDFGSMENAAKVLNRRIVVGK
jgi:phage shock protein E